MLKGRTVNKSDVIEKLSEKSDITVVIADKVVNTIFDTLLKSLSQDSRIEIRGFGTFVNRRYKSYKGRNPKTGQSINVKQKKLPFFKVGKALKDDLNKAQVQSRLSKKKKFVGHKRYK